MHRVCLSMIWSFLVLSLWNDVLGIRLAWLQRYVWVNQLSLIIHIVEMISYYLLSITILNYDCFEKLEAFDWSDVENESKYSGQVWFSLNVSLQKKFWNFIFAFSHFLASALISANRILCEDCISGKVGAIPCWICKMVILKYVWPECRGMFEWFSWVSLFTL
jgi:hypothetical protein